LISQSRGLGDVYKRQCEYMLRDVDRAHGVRSVSLRYFNASGACPDGSIGEYRSQPSHLVPSLMAVVNGDVPEFTLNGDQFDTRDGTAVRDYCHVWDIAKAHVAALEYLEAGGETDCFNIGSGRGTSVREVIAAVEAATGTTIPVTVGPARSGDIPENYADISMAEQVLQWRPERSNIQTIIADTLSWNNGPKFNLIRALDNPAK
jgi:UDP-arabinose 4-epimerase